MRNMLGVNRRAVNAGRCVSDGALEAGVSRSALVTSGYLRMMDRDSMGQKE